MASLDLEESTAGSTTEVPQDAESGNPFDTLLGGVRASYELQQCGSLPHGCRIEQATGVSAQYFFTVDASEGPYAPASLTFWIKIFDEFPAFDGVSIRATKKIFHPNIDQESGRLKVPQLETGRSESVCHMKDLLVAIRRLVMSPTDSPAVNQDAAMLLQTDREEFRRVVRNTLGGGGYRGASFDRVLDFGKKGASAKAKKDDPGEKQRQMSDKMRVELMQLDVMQAKLKALADDMITQNNVECCNLEASNEP
jgi:ubiquitin-conjugating enzyme E2 M